MNIRKKSWREQNEKALLLIQPRQCHEVEEFYRREGDTLVQTVDRVRRCLGVTKRSWFYWRAGTRPMPAYIRRLVSTTVEMIRRLDDAKKSEREFLVDLLHRKELPIHYDSEH